MAGSFGSIPEMGTFGGVSQLDIPYNLLCVYLTSLTWKDETMARCTDCGYGQSTKKPRRKSRVNWQAMDKEIENIIATSANYKHCEFRIDVTRAHYLGVNTINTFSPEAYHDLQKLYPDEFCR